MKNESASGQESRGSYFEQNGIRYYSERVRPVDQLDIDQLETSTASLVHIARHLTSLSPKAKARLIGQPIPEKEGEIIINDDFLDRQLATAGSKFHPAVTDLEELAAFCLKKIQEIVAAGPAVDWQKDESSPKLTADFVIEANAEDKQQFGIPNGEYFGTASLIEITPEIAGQVVAEQRGQGQSVDNLTVNIIRGITVPQTDNLIISLRRNNVNAPPYLYTAFTGISTPPFPRPEEQLPEEYQYNKDWWSRYAFIK